MAGSVTISEAIFVRFQLTTYSSWTWYASEGSPVDKDGMYDTEKTKVDYLMFGLVVGLETEFGYFSLTELANARGPRGLSIERDLDYKGDTLDALYQLHRH